ncbi:MAG: hypothetical protein IJB20_02780 [Clostridia bacterium]|nr:hypothetical protein [Clostridia bacterium]
MSQNELISKIEDLKALEQLIKEAEEEAEAIKDSIKAEMLEQNTEELIAGTYIVRWRTTLRSTFDTTSFKKKYDELYKAFTKQTTSRRFTIG